MRTKKQLLSGTIIFLFIMLSTSSISADIPQPLTSSTEIMEYIVVDETGPIIKEKLPLTEENQDFTERLTNLLDQLQSAHTYTDALQTIRDLIQTSNDGSIVERLIEILSDLNPFEKRVLIASHGRTRLVNPFQKYHINFFQPANLFWCYSGATSKIIQDKTVIIDPYPLFDIKVLDGRQIGLMRRFVGIYLFIPSALSTDSNVFFIGYAYKAIGIDLSPDLTR